MGLNETVSAERVHISFFGRRNAGKSSLVNAVTGQSLAVVSDVAGTTTDPVRKAMELLPLGPVVIIDTPGIDDEGALGALRVEKTRRVLAQTDIAVLTVDSARGLAAADRELAALFEEKKIPYVIAYSKADLLADRPAVPENGIYVSAARGENILELKEMLARLLPRAASEKPLISDLIDGGDTVVLVIPIDAAAPKGRLILPQQQTLRAVLDCGARALACGVGDLAETLALLKVPPRLVVTDSQAFGEVARIVPESVALTSFSILFARYKGDLEGLVRGAAKLDALADGDKILISEGCTHHRQCNDIGTVKIPNMIRAYTGKSVEFSFSSGADFADDLSDFALAVHCGGCMLNPREMGARIARAAEQSVPMTNYGVAIAHMNGILRRSLAPFPKIQKLI